MRHLPRLLCLGLFVILAACSGSGSAVPTVRDYTQGNPTHNVQPQSVVGLCPPDYPKCVGGGGGGTGGFVVYGSQGDCGTGYLYFSDGCDDIGTDLALYPNWQSWFTIADVALIKFNDSHYWAQHLVCYLTGSTNEQVDAAIADDFNVVHYKQAGDPPIGSDARFAFTYTDTQTGNKTITYAIHHYGAYTSGLINYDTYIVGTAFIRGLPNCP